MDSTRDGSVSVREVIWPRDDTMNVYSVWMETAFDSPWMIWQGLIATNHIPKVDGTLFCSSKASKSNTVDAMESITRLNLQ